MNYVLTIREGPEAGKRFSIESGRAYTVGRGVSCEIMLHDREISRVHCIINASEDPIMISDLESLNGTIVDGQQILTKILSGGESILVGNTTLEFAPEGAAAQRPEQPAPAAIAKPAPEAPAKPESPEPEPPADPAEAHRDTAAAEAPLAEPDRAEADPEPIAVQPAEVMPAEPIPVDPVAAEPASVQQEAVETDAEPVEAAPTCPMPGESPGHYNLVRIEQETTIQAFLAKHPKDSANKVFRWWQLLWYFALVAGAVLLFNYDWLYFFLGLSVLCVAYLGVALYKLAIVLLSAVKRREIEIGAAELRALPEWDLPVYTVLIPLYREQAVVEKIVHSVNALDYPQYKLDVKILLEPDDLDTIETLRQAKLPACCELIVVPASKPKTKPKACNHGLARARGEYLVIFDAEDRPDPDQLKKAVLAFRKAHKKTICLQAKLNYFNPRQNLLTRWFTVEYSTWFDLYLPGLHALGAPIPLGGTSNHFKTSVLREIGGWDPFNVTEDCDLGIRLHKMGYKTQVFDSTTWEEANSRLFNWIRQRSRWVKGYIQTHLVHMRNPLKTLWQLRPWGFSHFLASVGGLSLMLLLNPFFWAMGAVYLGLWAIDLANNDWSISTVMSLKQAPIHDILRLRAAQGERLSWHMLFWEVPRNAHTMTHLLNLVSQISWVMTLVLAASNLFFVCTHVLACIRRRMYSLIPYALLTPFYWVLISIGAWKGFLQLFFRPFYWEKTVHGLDSVTDLPHARPARRPAEGGAIG
ncbi:MAG TPA: glycosyltransferase [Planctomycetota bacterium]|nr:glycosyltransferase [Planctomycetota bacterium]